MGWEWEGQGQGRASRGGVGFDPSGHRCMDAGGDLGESECFGCDLLLMGGLRLEMVGYRSRGW